MNKAERVERQADKQGRIVELEGARSAMESSGVEKLFLFMDANFPGQAAFDTGDLSVWPKASYTGQRGIRRGIANGTSYITKKRLDVVFTASGVILSVSTTQRTLQDGKQIEEGTEIGVSTSQSLPARETFLPQVVSLIKTNHVLSPTRPDPDFGPLHEKVKELSQSR